MPRDFYPRPEAQILSWTAHFSAAINASPAEYGISPERAADYAMTQQTFAEAYAVARAPGTNSTVAVTAKEAARIALETATRPLVGIIKGRPTVTDAMRVNAGLSPRAARRGHVPPPQVAPLVHVRGTMGSVIQLRLGDAVSLRYRKPRDVYGADLFACPGEHAPEDPSQWRYCGSTTSTTTKMDVGPGHLPGTQVWIVARWTNARMEPGPASRPVYTFLQQARITRRPLRQAA